MTTTLTQDPEVSAANAAGVILCLVNARRSDVMQLLQRLAARKSYYGNESGMRLEVGRDIFLRALKQQGLLEEYAHLPGTYALSFENERDLANPIVVDFRYTSKGLYVSRVAFADLRPLTGDYFAARQHAS
jgi:hypothetical protein